MSLVAAPRVTGTLSSRSIVLGALIAPSRSPGSVSSPQFATLTDELDVVLTDELGAELTE